MPRTAPTRIVTLTALVALLGLVAGTLGLAVGTVTAAPAGASGPHAEWARGVRIPTKGNGDPFPSSTRDVRRGRSLTDLSVTLHDVRHTCVKDMDIMLEHNSRKTLLLSDVGNDGVDFGCHDVYIPTLTIDDSCPAFPNPVPSANRKSPGVDMCVRPTDQDGTGHNDDCFDGWGCYAANADPLWNTFHDRDPSGYWRLFVVDDAENDNGNIGHWEMHISTTDRPPTSTTTTVDVHKGQDATLTFPGTDPDGDPVDCTVYGGFLKGTISGSGCTRTYRANPRTSGREEMPYVTKDTAGHESPTGTVYANIVNRPPTANPVHATALAGQTTTLQLGGTDPDPNEPVTCTGVAQPRLGRVEGTGCTRTYVAGSTTGVDQFTYAVDDGFGGQASATISVAVTSSAPTADPKAVTAPKGSGTAIALTGTDPLGGALGCEVDATTAQGKGTLTGTGCTRTFTPNPGTSGTDTFTYRVRNGSGFVSPPATVTITIPNRAPVANTTIIGVQPGERQTVTFAGHDPDGDTVTCTGVGTPTLGRLEGTGCTRTFVGGSGYGSETFPFTVVDSVGATATGQAEVVMLDLRPRAEAVAVTAHKGAPATVTLRGGEVSRDGITCLPPTRTAQQKGTLAGTGCDLTYTPNPRTSGTDTFTYTVRDRNGRVSAPATVTIAIANRAPSAPTQAITVNQGDSAAVVLGGTDPDPGEGVALTCTPATGPTTRGRVTGSGCFATYTAGDTTGTDSFSYTVRDLSGATATGRVDVTVQGAVRAGCTAGEPQDARYVCRTYTDLLGRTADADGKAYWLGRLRSGENRGAIITSFTKTVEYRTSVVRGIWQAYLGTRPDAATEQRWVADLGRGANPDLVRQAALASATFYARAGSTPEGFVEGIHQQLLRRPATTTEVSTIAAQLRAGTSRATVATRLLGATDADTATVAAIYERFLRRSPGSETAYWVGRLQGGESELALVRLIVASPEYLQRA
jgi:hypothetical protein